MKSNSLRTQAVCLFLHRKANTAQDSVVYWTQFYYFNLFCIITNLDIEHVDIPVMLFFTGPQIPNHLFQSFLGITVI